MAGGNWEAKFNETAAKSRVLRNRLGADIRERVVRNIYQQAHRIAQKVVRFPEKGIDVSHKIDDLITSKIFGYPLMILLLSLVFWLTVSGANYPSEFLADLLFAFEDRLTSFFQWAGAPDYLHGALVLGMYRGLAWVVAVMLPPMLIFFPLFTFLEDLGYLPRVAFNLDNFFKKAGAHGKQTLTMCMGFGCNAAGVIACRIIESPRERLIAVLTNNFVPCNGRFPLLITMAALFIGLMVNGYNGLAVSAVVAGVVVLGVLVTLAVSWTLSKTILHGLPSIFTLELPPYRWPKIGTLLVRSVFDRTLFVLRRAVAVAAPAGIITWLLANTQIGEVSLLARLAGNLQGFGYLLGLDGYILLAFLLGLPANEIVVPILLMSYTAEGAMLDFDSIAVLRQLLVNNGWTWLTALNMLLFSLFHFPCATTLLTIRKETQSAKWTLLAALIPTIVGCLVCLVITQLARGIGLV